jgi:16S rRNA (cytosine1402-N4)-methyltransferase
MNQARKLSAREVVNGYDEEKLSALLYQYGEIKNAAKIAKLIATARKLKQIQTTAELKEVLMPAAERGKENKFFARVFQALRIEVNQELDALKEFLIQACEVLRQNGRLVVISYHSLEDKLVKNYLRSGNFYGLIEKDFYGNPLVGMRLINKRPIVPGDEEIRLNSRARSARLRIAEKI